MIVADSGPVIAFARIGRLDLLRRVASHVVIPEAVHEELIVKGGGMPGAAEIGKCPWIERRHLGDRTSIAQFPPTLHRGESEAIALARAGA